MQLARKSDAEIMAMVEPIMDNLMDASTAVGYPRHARDFTAHAKSMLEETRFRAVCAKCQAEPGFFAKREPVKIFRRRDSLAVAWRQAFTQAVGEFVAGLVLVEQDDAHQVDHVMVL